MAETKIEWTHRTKPDGTQVPGYTFNPWIGCTKVHEGCAHCYAEGFSKRTGKAVWGPNGTRVKTSPDNWRKPLKWNAEAEKDGFRRAVFCASLADVFEDWQDRMRHHGGRPLGVCSICQYMEPICVWTARSAAAGNSTP